jgi:Ricin-type beta-trefoil lectin domain
VPVTWQQRARIREHARASSRRPRHRRRQHRGTTLTGLATAVALAGLLAAFVAGPPASAATTSRLPAAVARALSRLADTHSTAAQLPASASFVTKPEIAAGLRGVRQACATPARPGQMACMALVAGRSASAGPDVSAGPDASAGRDVSAGPDASPPSGDAFDPSELQDAYGLTSAASTTVPSGGETIAVVDAYNDPAAGADLDAYRSAYGLGDCDQSNGCLKIVNQEGATTDLPKSDPTGGWELEESLDLDMVSAICPKCSIVLVEANTAQIHDLAIAERTATRSGANAVSNSWGSGAEFTGESAYDTDFYAPGVAITAAGGDDGYGTQYPAVSPYVTSVGGTNLTGSSGDWTQTAWNGTGSGCSDLEPKPSWQTADDSAPKGCLNRTDNDVSVVANPDPGVWVYDSTKDAAAGTSGGWNAVGGTSVGAPLVAAAYALADIVAGGAGKALIPGTFPAEYPYQHESDFTSVASGSNGSCEADRQYLCHSRAGYSGPTGVGALNGTAGLTGPSSGEVTIMDPGTQVLQTGAKIDLTLDVQPGAGSATITDSGLPLTMVIGGDGIITGEAPTKPGRSEVTVKASESGLPSATAKFAIVVVPKIRASHAARGLVRLTGAGLCLAGAHGHTAAGTAVQLARCARRRAELFEYVPGGGVTGSGEVKVGGRCLTIRSGSGNGAKASIQRCSGSSRQIWSYQASGHLRNSATGGCLAVHGSHAAGSRVVSWSCSGGASVGWSLPAAPVLSAVSGRCLADPRDSRATGTRIELARCASAASQRITPGSDGTLSVGGKCLGVVGNSMLDGAQIDLVTCSKSNADRWARGPDGELVNENSGRCLADPGNVRAAGTKLIQDDCYSEPGEIWVVS